MIGTGEIIVILCIILVLFGGKKLPEFARSLGKGIREFKKACYGEEDEKIFYEPIEEKKKEKHKAMSEVED
jgi:sec-independent protein translocase protein TatA